VETTDCYGCILCSIADTNIQLALCKFSSQT
jgi:hypothetical protein